MCSLVDILCYLSLTHGTPLIYSATHGANPRYLTSLPLRTASHTMRLIFSIFQHAKERLVANLILNSSSHLNHSHIPPPSISVRCDYGVTPRRHVNPLGNRSVTPPRPQPSNLMPSDSLPKLYRLPSHDNLIAILTYVIRYDTLPESARAHSLSHLPVFGMPTQSTS